MEGFLPPNMQGLVPLQTTPKNTLLKNISRPANCESIGSDYSNCKSNPNCRFDFVNQNCINK